MTDNTMTDNTVTEEAIKARVALGPLNRWWPVVASWMVTDTPLGLTRLGEKIVLWRDKDDSVHCVEDRCPHRGARLSMGWNLGDRIACWYHGVEVGGDGVVKDVPAVGECPLVGEKCIKSYPVFEHMGGIFAWFGDELHEEAGEFDMPEEFVSDEWGAMLCTAHWNCNWTYAVDNVMDPMHGAYLHAVSHSMAEGDLEAKMQIDKTDTGFIFGKSDQRDVNFDWIEWADTGAFWLRVSPLPYRQAAGPGGNFGIIGFVTPIDEENCRVFFWRTRKVQGWQRDAWKFMYRHKLETLHWDVLEQDRVVLSGMEPDARDHEFLYQHDTGLARTRRELAKEAEKQLNAVAAAENAHAAAAE
ncbi:MAG: Rieske 2Fe-2S domain-containing protein [Rhodospirillaceae bacterium]|jgi:phenylpropionate dioxygenase-like ring-hydroxylating dioxygenase large terminal subunit|nr:Rieske 2Fe-2S domain-containing protein [Rhodospirillaceae bacterium]